MLSVITVSFRSKAHLRQCLQSIRDASPLNGDYEHIVVDNDSHDGTVEMISSSFPEVMLFRNEQNVGFAKAVNQGMEAARGDMLLLLNPDCLVPSGAIEELKELLDTRPEVAAASPMLVTPQGDPQISYARFPRLVPHLLGLSPLGWLLPRRLKDIGFSGIPQRQGRGQPTPVDAPAGSCLLVRRAAYESVGGMDEDFFTYYEDIDWAYRMAKAGWERYYVPGVRIIHDMGATWGELPEGVQLFRSYEGKYRYFEKRHGRLGGNLVRWTTVCCARLNILIARILLALRVGGPSWRRKLDFNTLLLDVHKNQFKSGI